MKLADRERLWLYRFHSSSFELWKQSLWGHYPLQTTYFWGKQWEWILPSLHMQGYLSSVLWASHHLGAGGVSLCSWHNKCSCRSISSKPAPSHSDPCCPWWSSSLEGGVEGAVAFWALWWGWKAPFWELREGTSCIPGSTLYHYK